MERSRAAAFTGNKQKMKGLLQNGPNEKRDRLPREGLSISFFVVSGNCNEPTTTRKVLWAIAKAPCCSAAAHSHCFSTSFSLFRSSGLAICSFMPVFLASCTSSAKAFAVIAMMGTLPRLPVSARIAAVAS